MYKSVCFVLGCSVWLLATMGLVIADELSVAVDEVAAFATAKKIASLENKKITESSGICASRQNPGIYWTHNDSGSGPYLFAFNEKGQDMGTLHLATPAQDFEDIAAATIRGKNYILVGNTGANGHQSGTGWVDFYLLEEPVVDASNAKTMRSIARDNIRTLTFRWPGNKQFNCEAVALGSDGVIYIATKGWPTVFFIFRAAALTGDSADSIKRILAFPRAKLLLCVTGMDISKDGRSLLFIYDPYAHGMCAEFTLPGRSGSWATVPYSDWIKKEYGCIGLGAPQAEGVCYSRDGKFILATSECGKNRTARNAGIFMPGGHTPLYKVARRPAATTVHGASAVAAPEPETEPVTE